MNLLGLLISQTVVVISLPGFYFVRLGLRGTVALPCRLFLLLNEAALVCIECTLLAF